MNEDLPQYAEGSDEEKAYDEGVAAYSNGNDADDNPYQTTPHLQQIWQQGFDDARNDDDGTCPECDFHMEDCICPQDDEWNGGDGHGN